MKTRLVPLIALSGIALLGSVPTAFADTAEAACEVRKEGETRKGASGPCTFSQRQGYITLRLKNGDSFDLSPGDKQGVYRDQKGNKVVRKITGQGTEEFKWEGGKKILLTYPGSTGAAVPAATVGAVAPGERSDEFGTVCGVITGGKTYSYRCTATDIYSGNQKVRTVLRYPDQTIELTWKAGKQVGLQFEGMTPQVATFSTYEGETNFIFEDKTYFYWSDKGAAKMELQNFKN